ncbi:hypothetical protein H6CHR_05442 [Variovorax sp. PBL-H6]|uniref:hypothetical protein n=1 Tax=Variovorax sp. PBL-H6 TaxID=434009 RepID=UPI0013169612|nr:hypothetical protein [Variovorax sp. PBL-H6]VTU39306.1 hypothetical protein H6CHR_05442 [Variovorax sp. PBL-H6]
MTLRAFKVWAALLLIPSIALLFQTLAYAAVPHSCTVQTAWLLHALSIAALLACVVATLLASHELHRLRGEPQAEATLDSDAAAPVVRQGFMAAAAAGVGLLFTLVVGMQWFAAWVLSPCLQ